MKNKRVDVLVIGAGPAGSLCARNLASKGYQVLLCEKRAIIGDPVRCGEATGTRKRLSEFVSLSEDWFETSISGVILHGPGGHSIRYDAGKEIGIMLDRKLFDQALAREAKNEGADVQTDARVTGITESREGYREVTVVQGGETFTIQAKMVVGADGAESLSGRWVGLKTRQLPPHTCSAIELRIKAVDANPNFLTFWQGHDSINKGYIWVFPKVKSGVINLGSGIITPKMGEQNMLQLSTAWRDKYFPGAEIEEVHGGCVPVSGNLESYTADRFLLCGDAAHHTNPLTGGGIMASLLAADLAAQWIDRGLQTGNLNHGYLQGYERACWETFGHNHHREGRIRDFVLGLPPRDQEVFYGIFKNMVDAKFSKWSQIKGYAKLLPLGIKHWNLAKPVLKAGKKKIYPKASTAA